MSPQFKKIYLEISNICNLQCSFCPVVEREKQIMSLTDLEDILLQIKPYAERVCFHVMGEPLNHPHFVEAIGVAEKINVALEITTNGTLLSEKTTVALLSPNVKQVNFSLQSFVDNYPKANPETYFSKILSFCEKAEKERNDLYINFRFWNLPPGEKQNEINEFFLTKIEDHFQTQLNRNVDPGFNKSKKIRGKIYAHFDTRFEWPNKKGPLLGQEGTCWGARSQIAIHADKRVVPCCLDKEADVLLGHLEKNSIREILNSTTYLNLKEGFEKNELRADLCQRCTFRTRFQNSTSMTV